MLRTLRSHATYANVSATLALFIALGAGSATAARMITGADVRDNSLTGRDVRSITTRDVRDRSLLARDFALGQLPRGEKGEPGKTGTTNVVIRTGPSGHGDCFQNCTGVYNTSSVATCLPGERATGGGVEAPSQFEDEVVTASRPTTDQSGQVPVGWLGKVRFRVAGNSAAIPDPAVWVICASR